MKYAVLHHTGIPEAHYDLLIETIPGSDLSTWRIPVWPVEDEVDATRLKDHRRFYLNYEGEIPSHRGRVDRVAGGDCEVEVGADAVWTFDIRNGGAIGRIELRQIAGDQWRASPL